MSAASVGSSSRQVAGRSPAWSSRRTAVAPVAKSGAASVAAHRCTGRGWARSQAEVMTPSVPSLPSSTRSGLGPAPEAGSRRDSQTPVGVTARTDSTRSSTWVGPAEKCPAARVAIQPPTVERSKLCG